MTRAPNQNQVTSPCCCPEKVKFFIFGNTWINNYNAACQDFDSNGWNAR